MPLPFSFSTQREPTGPVPASPLAAPLPPSVEDENITPGGGAGIVLSFAPPPPPVFTPVSMTPAALPRPVTAPQTAFPNTQEIREASHAPTTHLSAPAYHAPAQEPPPAMQEVTMHLDQLRNDLFAAATNISALNDRLERLESRPVSLNSHQAEIAALRADIERWICHHLESAVEQSMRRIWERSHGSASPTTPAQ